MGENILTRNLSTTLSQQCDPKADPMVDLSTFFIVIDCILTFIFSAELVATIYASRKRSSLFFDLLVIIDVCALLPWYITVGWMMRHHLAPFGDTHAITAGFAADPSIGAHFTTWFLLLHMFKILRVFKVGRHLPGKLGRVARTVGGCASSFESGHSLEYPLTHTR